MTKGRKAGKISGRTDRQTIQDQNPSGNQALFRIAFAHKKTLFMLKFLFLF